MRNLVLYAAVFMTTCIVIGFVMASLLNQKIKSEAVFRTIFVFPFAVSGIVTGVVWRWLLYPPAGLNLLFDNVGLDFLKNNWYTAQWGTLAIDVAAAWQFTGYVMSLYLAGLRGINAELKEAAQIDGASTWQLYRRIIIPMLIPVTFTVIVLTGMGSIRVFESRSCWGGRGVHHRHAGLPHVPITFQTNRIALGAIIATFMIMLAALLVGPYLASLQLEDSAMTATPQDVVTPAEGE